jgi:hypothetical protein
VIRCENCGSEVEEGRGFCPHCGKPLAPDGKAVASGARSETVVTAPEPQRAATLSSFERAREEKDGSRRWMFVAVAVVSALLVAGLIYLASRPAARPGEERLEGAIRPGSPEFPAPDRLVVEFEADDRDATIGQNSLGNWVVTMKPTVRNFTGRTVSGLEFHAAGVDLDGKVIRERTYVSDDEIAPNKTSTPVIAMSFPQDNKPADLKLELTGVKFK